MSKVKVSETMQRAVRKLQSRMGTLHYQSLSSDEAPSGKRRASLPPDDDGDHQHPSDVPQGSLAVYVGRERRRFVISAKCLQHHMFQVLLEKSAEELGFEHQGGLPIACDVAYFEHLLCTIQSQSAASLVTHCSCFSVYSSCPR